MPDRIERLAKAMADLADAAGADIVRIEANARANPMVLRRLTVTLAEHYPGLTVEEVRQAIIIAVEAKTQGNPDA